jgi:hypothetical protein
MMRGGEKMLSLVVAVVGIIVVLSKEVREWVKVCFEIRKNK